MVLITIALAERAAGKAFSVRGFPAFAIIDDSRRILATGYELGQVPLPAAA